MVDEQKLPFNTGVELSYLDGSFQEKLKEFMYEEQLTPSLSQARKLKQYFQDGKLTEDVMAVLLENKNEDNYKLTLKSNQLNKFFTKEYTPKQIEKIIFGLLEDWQNGQKK